MPAFSAPTSHESLVTASSSKQPPLPLLEIEQHFFAPATAAVTAQFAVRIHDAMTGNDYRARVRTVRRSDSTRRFRITERPRDGRIRTGFSVRNVLERGPDALLKRRAIESNRHLELAAR